VGTDKRARQKANRQRKIEELEKAEQQDKFRQYATIAVVVLVVLIGGLALISFATGGDDEAETTEAGAEDASTSSDDATADDSSSDDSASEAGDGGSDDATDNAGSDTEESAPAPGPDECPAEDGSSPRVLAFDAAPPTCIDPAASYTALFDTNLGQITVALDAQKAPNTVNNFVYLARYHYYDGVAFHRIIKDFMIQGGDATGDPPGTGGPGYTIEEEVPQAGEYKVGSIAMAKRSAPGTTGAQFFIVTGPNGEALPPQYSLFGEVTEGLDVVKAIEDLPTDASDYPTEDIIINSITITEA
jgi:cyclophilin family peptidyl-prolyl cis-trans isomerase